LYEFAIPRLRCVGPASLRWRAGLLAAFVASNSFRIFLRVFRSKKRVLLPGDPKQGRIAMMLFKPIFMACKSEPVWMEKGRNRHGGRCDAGRRLGQVKVMPPGIYPPMPSTFLLALGNVPSFVPTPCLDTRIHVSSALV
jgi:hypothetical protein